MMKSCFRFALWPIVMGSSLAFARDTVELHPLDQEVVRTQVFLRHHPDVRWRLDGLAEMERGNVRIALAHFHRAARFGDKVAQGIIAEAYWLGRGTAKDRPLAYAWMDLAAERGYPMLVGKREHYWAALSDQDRSRAIEVGQAVYEEFGDAAAIPRLDAEIDKGRRLITGSRAGNGSYTRSFQPSGPADSLSISAPVLQFSESPGGGGALTKIGSMRVHASGGKEVVRMWSDHFWKTEQYLAWKAINLDGAPDTRGVVEVLPLRQPEE